MSAVTVREVLTLPVLRGSSLVAGAAGLDRQVSGVNVMEVPDIESFVEPGEVLLTTAYPLRDHPEALGELVRTLARLGLAALAVKTGRYLDELPHPMLDAADELGLPLLVLAPDTSFNEVIGAVLAVVLSDYGADPAGAEAIRERLTGVALTGGGLDEIARTLAGALERRVDIVDETGAVLVGGGGDGTPAGSAWAFPVSVAGTERARILVDGADEPTLGQRRLIRQACFAAGMHIAQAFASVELDRQMRTLYLEELVSGRGGDLAVLAQRARLFGWELSGDRVVLLAQCSSEVPDSALVASRALGIHSYVWARGREVVAIVPADPAPAAGAWRAELERAGAGAVTVAAGRAHAGIEGLPASHRSAREALTIASATGRAVVEHDHLTVERAILAIDREALQSLVELELGPLLAADRSTGSQLCQTLETYLATGNAAESARTLFIHYNTMKHRLGRISALLGDRIEQPDARLALAFALRARKLLSPAIAYDA